MGLFRRRGIEFICLSLLSVPLWGSLSACSGRNIHSDLDSDPRVLVRQWTRSTRQVSSFKAGEKGTEYSNPVQYENTIIFGNQGVGLISLYSKLNQVRWVLELEEGVVSPLTVDGSSVYFGSGNGFLYSVDADTGNVNWRYPVRNPVLSQPVVKSGRLFATASDNTVYSLDAGTGDWIWHYRRPPSGSAATIRGASTPLVAGSEVIVGMSDGYLVSLSLEEGKLKWEKRLHRGRKFTDVDASPQLENGRIYVPSYDGALYALNQKNGQILWRFDSGGGTQVLMSENRIYLPSSDGYVYAIDKMSGKRLWRFELDKGVPTRLSETDRYLIFASSYRYLYALDRITGKAVYRYDVGEGSGFSGAPLYIEELKQVFFLSGAGNLYAFSVRQSPSREYKMGRTDPYIF